MLSMPRLLFSISLSFVLLLPIQAASAASAMTAQSLFDAILQGHGAENLDYGNTVLQFQGNLSFPNRAATAFTLTCNRHRSRMETAAGKESVVTIRNGERMQNFVNGVDQASKPTPAALSPLNLTSVFALLNLDADERFDASLAESKDGQIGIQYRQVQEHPPFRGSNLTVTVWLDSANRVSQIDYLSDRTQSLPVTYLYSYDRTLSGAFLQPAAVQCYVGDKLLFSADLNFTTQNVSVPPDYFNITR
jgi:hypothetical protein